MDKSSVDKPRLLEGAEAGNATVVSETTPRLAGRVVDPSVAGQEDDEVPVEQLSVEPPAALPDAASPQAVLGSERVPDEPSLRPHTFPPMPASEVLLDPGASPPPVPQHRPRRATPTVLSPSMTAVFGTLFGLAGIFAIFALLQRFSPHPTPALVASSSPLAHASPPGPSASSAAVEAVPEIDEGAGIAGPWRVAVLKDEEGTRIIEGTVGRETLVDTLESKHINRKEIYRILSALKTFKVLDHPGKNSKYIAAVDRGSGRIKAFELEVSPTEVYQARENEEQRLAGDKLDMKIASRRTLAGVRIGDDLSIDLRRARLRDSVADVVDRAFDGRAHLSGMSKGSTLKVVVVEQTALGRFASYEYVEALEYVSGKDGAEPLRIYRVRDGNHWGYFDQKGKEPFRGGWRRPCPNAPITSPFNPRRLHPVLKIIKPHLGTDFGAPTGTPIHACYYGTVAQMGPSGPAGNLIVLKHPGDIESYYMHQSRFAAGLHVGDKVETFQVIGFVGTTGRSTGPHLHFGIKKKGDWIDAMSLKLDGERVISKDAREAFDKARAELDGALDSIALPAAPAAVVGPPAASGSGSAEPSSSAEPAQGVDETEGLDELEPEGTVDPNDKPDPKKK